MTPSELKIKEAAEQIVGKYREKMLSPTLCEYCFDCEDKNGDLTPCKAKTTAAKHCATIHCQGIIDVLKSFGGSTAADMIWDYEQVLNEINAL